MCNEYLPEWASAVSDGDYMIPLTQLCTRDGRRMGNAVVVSVTTVAQIVTDMGTHLQLTEGELQELFHTPTFIMSGHPYIH